MPARRKSPGSLKAQRERLAARLPDAERLLRGSLVERYKKCGKPGCHCVDGKGHGPSYYLSVTLSAGKTRSYYVAARDKELIERYLANYRKLREVTEAIMQINGELLRQGELEEES